MRCNKCGKEVHSDSVFCSSCGVKIARSQNKKRWVIPLSIVMGVILVGTAVFAGFHFMSGKDNKTQEVSATSTKEAKSSKKDNKAEKRKFKEVDGKIEVYLPVETTSTMITTPTTSGENDMRETEQSTATCSMKYDSRGLLVSLKSKELDETSGSYTNEFNRTVKYSSDYRMTDTFEKRDDEESETQYSYNPDGELIQMKSKDCIYVYDEHTGQLISKTDVNRGETISYSYEFDENGNIVHWENDLFGSNSYEAFDYTYNSQGRLEKIIDLAGEKDNVLLYSKDGLISGGSLSGVDFGTDCIEYNKDGKPITARIGNWDIVAEYRKGLVSEMSVLNMGASMDIEYDENQNMSIINSKVQDSSGTCEQITKITYEAHYVDKNYWQYYLAHYYDTFLTDALWYGDSMWAEFGIVEINADKLQDKIVLSLAQLAD